ncbi:hypothetical protein PR202_gb20150 [Eleusine coracana subsp. coracana]|uniref:Jacalin-type lectin domain-containing protein n=1 Tax=Eleusine coracana subsp. coracana TaxID=191504 RepID=A0AAV5FAN7_ELECO|nr:hypothetical protein PR202_gb20150 [Eleusine coracana subsp. coracana]
MFTGARPRRGITNLFFVTNIPMQLYGPFRVGKLESQNHFSIPTKNDSSIVGFFAHNGKNYVNGRDVYIKPF